MDIESQENLVRGGDKNPSRPSYSNDEYTVGWICAIRTEYIAARVFLDEEHDQPKTAPHDNNVYTLGKIGKHNVVLAVLPDGEYGIAAAASVAGDLLHSFPHVRIGLMVGIGGGVPSRKHDIRLGDIVKNYKRPDSSTDRLFRPEITHESNCAVNCIHDSSNLITRSERTEDEDNPAIHYGLIASANQLMKDASIRDKLAAEKDVLCFEMEAAGLMNHFPCLVIRGICDYSDSHKSKEWQGYAAIAAAAYAKDLLCRMSLSTVEAERRIGELLTCVASTVSKTGEHVEAVMSNLEKNENLEVLNWLTPVDYGPQHSDFLWKRQPGTGQWLLDSAEYQTWLGTAKQTLFCPGIPGAGKTILTAIVIDDLCNRFRTDATTGIAYLYCNFRRQGEQKVHHLLASLLKQLTESQSSLPSNIKDLYNHHKAKRTQPSTDEISKALQSVATVYSRVFIIVDALDECQVLDGCRSNFLSEIFDLQAKTGANFLATSRFIQDISRKFERSLSLTIRATDEDVQTYLAAQMNRLPSFVQSSPDLQTKIKLTIAQVANGMFLLAPLHIFALAREPTIGDVELALGNLPRGIDETYEEAMARVDSQGGGIQELAKKILSLVVHARRVLSTTELRHAVAVKAGKPELDEKFIPSHEIIGSICAGLVTIDSQSEIVGLVHHTTQEYFDKTKHRWFPNAEEIITMTCVNYLSFRRFESGFCPTDEVLEERLQSNPLYEYAAQNWGHHARAALAPVERKAKTQLEQLILGFLQNEATVSASSQALLASKRHIYDSGYSQRVPTQMIGIQLAAYFGLMDVMMALIRNGHDPDLRGTDGRTPLSWAAGNGHIAVTELLLAVKGVDPKSRDKHGRTALAWAALNAHDKAVEVLLSKVSILSNLNDNSGHTPLSLAASSGHKKVVRMLLGNCEVNPDTEDNMGRTPLSRSAENGHTEVVKMLLAKGSVDLNSKDIFCQTPLWWAVRKGQNEIIKILLAENDIDPNAKDQSGQTPLRQALQRGNKETRELLLADARVNWNAKDEDGQTPCRAVTYRPIDSSVMLLEEYDDLRLMGMFYEAPLSPAGEEGKEVRVQLLLEKCTNLESNDKYGQTPLLIPAAKKGNERIVELILEKSPDVESKDILSQTPRLLAAAKEGNKWTVELLLKKGADIEAKDTLGQNPLLLAAAEKGNERMVELLLERGADIEARDTLGQSPLLLAAEEEGNERMVELLLEKGAYIEAKDALGQTSLSLAVVKARNERMVQLLLKKGADIESKDAFGETPLLLAAAKEGNERIVQLLLENGANIKSKDKVGRTSLEWAAKKGNELMVQLLLKEGASS